MWIKHSKKGLMSEEKLANMSDDQILFRKKVFEN